MNEYLKQTKDFLQETNTTCRITFRGKETPKFWGGNDLHNAYSVKLKNDNHQFTFRFYDSLHNTAESITPNEYDVLTCLTKYDPEDFEYFCDSYGYDKYSRKSKAIYNAVCKEWENVYKMFNSEELEKFQEIQ